MRRVNQLAVDIRLRKFFPGDRDDAWGSSEGSAAREKILRVVEAHPEAKAIRISLKGVSRVDVSFVRESVLELAYQQRGRRGVCVTDVPSKDVMENLEAAARVRQQALVVWEAKGPRLIGPKVSEDTWELLQFVLKRGDVSTAEVAKGLGKQVNNVSTRLKRMSDEGLVLRHDVSASSGGLEYRYLAIS